MPFIDIPPHRVLALMRMVTTGVRPSRPSETPEVIAKHGFLFDSMWRLAQVCWVHSPNVRPPIALVASLLGMLATREDVADTTPLLEKDAFDEEYVKSYVLGSSNEKIGRSSRDDTRRSAYAALSVQESSRTLARSQSYDLEALEQPPQKKRSDRLVLYTLQGVIIFRALCSLSAVSLPLQSSYIYANNNNP